MHCVNNECLIEITENKSYMETTGSDVAEVSPDKRYIRYNEILGRGAFKNVYKAFDEINGIEVAWNLVNIEDALQSPEHLQRLYSEVHLLRTLKHENVLRSYASWVDDTNKTVNVITELFTSGSLRQFRKKHKSVDKKAIKNWARQILRGLDYLHTHNPPVIHRDLKCDNIFVNGNHGKVKIGDLGMATIMQKPTARSVIGTPEFMAPELYEEEYNELVDIYSFGMCILELVTCEYPYSECKNQAQIYKKVTSGIKPAALGKVMDIEVKRFIEKCLVPASHRLSAAQLLEEPFLFENHKDDSCDPLQLPDFTSKSVSSLSLKSDSPFMDVDTCSRILSMSTCCDSTTGTSMPTLELHSSSDKHEFSLKGEKFNGRSIELTLRIADYSGRVRNVYFPFFLDSDTALSIAEEMVTTLELWEENIGFITELINRLISQFVVTWRTPCGSLCLSTEQNGSNVKEEGRMSKNVELAEVLFQNTTSKAASEDTSKDLFSSDCYVKDSGTFRTGSWVTAPSDMSLSFSSFPILDDDDEGLKAELDAINLDYQKRFQELVKMKEAAVENAKTKWMMKKSSAL